MAIDFGTTDVGNTPIPVTDNSGSLTVDAVSWPLPTGAATAALQTQPGVDIGDVTINNSTGAAAVNVQDGGNSLTIDGVTYTGEQDLALKNQVFSTNFEITGLGTAETPVALFRNPTGSGKTVKLIRLTLVNLSTSASVYLNVRAYGGPTVTTDGTGLTEVCTHVGQAGPVSVTFSSPTVSANGTRLAQWLVPSFTNPTLIPLDMLYILDANTQLLLTAQADGNNRILGGSLLWAEV